LSPQHAAASLSQELTTVTLVTVDISYYRGRQIYEKALQNSLSMYAMEDKHTCKKFREVMKELVKRK